MSNKNDLLSICAPFVCVCVCVCGSAGLFLNQIKAMAPIAIILRSAVQQKKTIEGKTGENFDDKEFAKFEAH